MGQENLIFICVGLTWLLFYWNIKSNFIDFVIKAHGIKCGLHYLKQFSIISHFTPCDISHVSAFAKDNAAYPKNEQQDQQRHSSYAPHFTVSFHSWRETWDVYGGQGTIRGFLACCAV
jgi:hypothetical protein